MDPAQIAEAIPMVRAWPFICRRVGNAKELIDGEGPCRLLLLDPAQVFDNGQNTARDDVLRIAGEVEVRLVRVGLG